MLRKHIRLVFKKVCTAPGVSYGSLWQTAMQPAQPAHFSLSMYAVPSIEIASKSHFSTQIPQDIHFPCLRRGIFLNAAQVFLHGLQIPWQCFMAPPKPASTWPLKWLMTMNC